MNSNPSLSIVIPSYNARRYLRRCLRTLREQVPDAEVIVVDGESQDDSAEMVAKEFPEVVLRTCRNHGWAHATNRGVEIASGDFFLFLNSDAFPQAEPIRTMKRRLTEQTDLAAVAPMLENEDGSRQAVFGFWYWPTWKPINRPTTVPVASAACMMTTREKFAKIGAFDETFFLYNEELDWCHRAKEAGYRIELVPVSVTHVGGGSTARDPMLRLEAQRAFVYLSTKHWPEWITTVLRESMKIEGWIGKHVDPRPRHREMWAKLESTMRRGAFRESPFELSGRGVPNFTQDFVPADGE